MDTWKNFNEYLKKHDDDVDSCFIFKVAICNLNNETLEPFLNSLYKYDILCLYTISLFFISSFTKLDENPRDNFNEGKYLKLAEHAKYSHIICKTSSKFLKSFYDTEEAFKEDFINEYCKFKSDISFK